MMIACSKRFPVTLTAIAVLGYAAIATIAAPVRADAVPGKPAPDFTTTDSNGRAHKLSDLKGKTVVLEWTNDGCPYVRKPRLDHKWQLTLFRGRLSIALGGA